MNLDRENMRKIKELILFTIIVLIALWNYGIIIDAVVFVFGIIFPFLLGGGIAFVLNVPMNFMEEKVFYNRWLKNKKIANRLARPVSLVLTLLIVIGVVALVMFVVIPELTRTILSLGITIRDFVPEAQRFLEELFTDNSEISAWLDSLNLNVDRIMESAVGFFQNGAGNILNSTMSAIGSIVSGVTTFVIAFVFACYVLLQKEKLRVQVQKVMYAFLSEKRVEWCLEVCSLTNRSFTNFLTGQCVEALILGMMFFVVMNIFSMPYSLLVSVLIAFTALIPIFGAFIGCFVGALLILMVDPLQAVGFIIMFLVLQQIEGNLIYPKVVGRSVGLPSIWVLAAVTIGGSLMGIVGMLIFIPIVSVVYNLFRASVYKHLRKKHRNIKNGQPEKEAARAAERKRAAGAQEETAADDIIAEDAEGHERKQNTDERQ
ncbi:AI-2E family transporter [Lachnoclostridium sp. An169]|uniref:AI-2E family transporter n=1 Tax=Lachnoclostridium sp. An169 TaxID=1965569 RepID=UPI000B3A64BB|nr:AI-2E family transporter [Lachnoclostridium sp. An169]OUP83272.1 AI-2E family transporter [Lachnoclostridium sp. An169]